MYYYIFDSPQNNDQIASLEDRIRNFVSDLGIAGEITTPTHARTVDYLIGQALDKRYSTIVAVGGIKHITTVASRLVGLNVVFGAIPLDFYPELHALLNIKNWQEAAYALKFRRYTELRLGVIEPGGHIFLTACQINLKNSEKTSIVFPRFQIENLRGQCTVKLHPEGNCLEFEIESSKKIRLISLFAKKESSSDLSYFKQVKGQILAQPPASLSIDGIEITRTPVSLSLHPKKLKMIIAKKNLDKTKLPYP